MKKIIITILLFLPLSLKMYGINETLQSPVDSMKKFFLGPATGINNINGILGATLKARLHKTLFIKGGLGLGMWGYKISAGIHYDLKQRNCWGFGAGYSRCTGIPELTVGLETLEGKNVVMKNVALELLPTGTVNLTAERHWLIKNKHIIYLDLGYAVPAGSKPYKVKDQSVLTKTSESVLNRLQPGGLIIGFGFLFGL